MDLNNRLQQEILKRVDIDLNLNNYQVEQLGESMLLRTETNNLFIKIKKNDERIFHEKAFLESLSIVPIVPKVFTAFSIELDQKYHILIREHINAHTLEILDDNIINKIAISFSLTHKAHRYTNPGNKLPPNYSLPYECPLYDQCFNNPKAVIVDNLEDITKARQIFNQTKIELKEWFLNQNCFEECLSFHICYNNFSRENFVYHQDKVFLIDWSQAIIDIPEIDLAGFIVYNNLTDKQKDVFLTGYWGQKRDEESMERLSVLTRLWLFWRILDEFLIKKENKDVEVFVQSLESLQRSL